MDPVDPPQIGRGDVQSKRALESGDESPELLDQGGQAGTSSPVSQSAHCLDLGQEISPARSGLAYESADVLSMTNPYQTSLTPVTKPNGKIHQSEFKNL